MNWFLYDNGLRHETVNWPHSITCSHLNSLLKYDWQMKPWSWISPKKKHNTKLAQQNTFCSTEHFLLNRTLSAQQNVPTSTNKWSSHFWFTKSENLSPVIAYKTIWHHEFVSRHLFMVVGRRHRTYSDLLCGDFLLAFFGQKANVNNNSGKTTIFPEH